VAGGAEDVRLAAWWPLLAAHALLVQRVGRDLAAGISLPLAFYNVLRLVHETPGARLRLGELAGAVLLTRSGVTRLANRLERAGLLRREEHAQDRRGSCAILTDRGRSAYDRAIRQKLEKGKSGGRVSLEVSPQSSSRGRLSLRPRCPRPGAAAPGGGGEIAS
jgi:DNA-binding MarR family transcriptional regulator